MPGIEAAGTVDAAPAGSGLASGQQVVAMMGDMDFSRNEYLPRGVRLAGHFGDAADLPPDALQEILDAVAAGQRRGSSPVGGEVTAAAHGVG